MNPTKSPKIVIIGSGLAGLALALALHQANIPCTLYESRESPLDVGGAVMLSPNAMKILDALGLYESVRGKGYNIKTLEYKDNDGKVLETYEFGSQEKYGYDGLRIYRTILINELLGELKKKQGVNIVFNKKFARILEETDEKVVFEFADGTTESADILVGADGIHSTVRRYLYPDLKPTFTRMAGITGAVPTSQLKASADDHLLVTISNKYGGVTIAPQKPDGSEVLIGKQQRIPEDLGRAGWAALLNDKDSLVRFLQQDSEHYPAIWQNAVSDIPLEKMNVWPFYIVPKLEKWASDKRRVIILGDAAHAIPPSAGQGINQAFEDVYIFALLLAQGDKVDMQSALSFWQEYRQKRVEKVLWLNSQIEFRRMSQEEKDKLPPGTMQEFDLGWLFLVDFKGEVEAWVTTQTHKAS